MMIDKFAEGNLDLKRLYNKHIKSKILAKT